MKRFIIYPLLVGLYFGGADSLYAEPKYAPTPQSFQILSGELSRQKSRLEWLTGRKVKNWPSVADKLEVNEEEDQKKLQEIYGIADKIRRILNSENEKSAEPETPTTHTETHVMHQHTGKCTFSNGYVHCKFSDSPAKKGKCTFDNDYVHCDFSDSTAPKAKKGKCTFSNGYIHCNFHDE